MVVAQGDVYWADFRIPPGFEPGYRRPIVVIQGDDFNNSRIRTAVCVLLTGNVRRAQSPGNVLLRSSVTGLPKDSVANVTQMVSIDKAELFERVGHLPYHEIAMIHAGIDVMLGRRRHT